ncbi:uncharacterized protein LOC123404209 isoform X1 [Hordeum vulgare subsp. vulgare]|uniref:KIB1-4 beta-propeller domain-containing protein n=1 Tax=Hordeum vulgare subsp. vulgare TaxID=112509 RepID=A0A8I6YX57_HORVV|nr:uncharacterized protein LOC123404209 isoform X1 [Hordeum vulgare subsp. vulgare]
MADWAPMAAPAPPPAKRKKEDPNRLQTWPLLPSTAAAGWSGLPPDLLRRVADSLLATNDLDCYMHLRAACPGWRAATEGPKAKDSSGSDRRFEPRRWILLDEVFRSEGEEMLLVNADTGRFLRRRFPMLRDHYAVATTPSGYFVLADKSPPHAASVLNPLTGAVVRFRVPVPPQMGAADVVSGDDGSPLKLVFICNSSHERHYTADPDSRSFTVHERTSDYNFLLKAAVGGGVRESLNQAGMSPILMSYLRAYSFPPGLSLSMLLPNVFSGCTYAGDDDRGFLVGLDGHMLLVFRKRTAVYPSVLRLDAATRRLEPMRSISRFAIFAGHRRCVAVDAHKLPGVEPNCVYFTRHLNRSTHIWKYNFGFVKAISQDIDFVERDDQFVLVADRPFTIVHLLSSYTINMPDSQLPL